MQSLTFYQEQACSDIEWLDQQILQILRYSNALPEINEGILLMSNVLQGNMRMMIDAEQTYMQPAIDALTIALQQKYNRTAPVIMNTYQCYLKVSLHMSDQDMLLLILMCRACASLDIYLPQGLACPPRH